MGRRPHVGLFDFAPFGVVGDLALRKLPPSLYARDRGATARSGRGYWRCEQQVSEHGFRAQGRLPIANLSPTKISLASSPGSGLRAKRLSAGGRYGLRPKRGDQWRADRKVSRLGGPQELPWASALLRLYFHGAGISR
jgi:hypothetical protein